MREGQSQLTPENIRVNPSFKNKQSRYPNGPARQDKKEIIMKNYNVLCVSKLEMMDCGQDELYLPITGQAILKKRVCRGNRIDMVIFDDREFKLINTKSGLKDNALVLVVTPEDDPLTVWELYTDSPTRQGVTREEVRRRAQIILDYLRLEDEE